MVEKPSCARMVATSSSTSSCFMKFCTRSFASVSLLASASDSVMTFRSQPVSWLARRMFWPPRPMACDSLSSATAMSMECESSSTTIDSTSAGDMELMTNCAGFSSCGMMSTRSPAISLDTACTREPRIDRKSTRLNSSHTVISYAVFCLKKKKKKKKIRKTQKKKKKKKKKPKKKKKK